MIVKDDSEIQDFKRCLASFMPQVDGLAVAITGNTPNNGQIIAEIERYKGKYIVTTPETHPKIYVDGIFSHFAEARNVSFELADTMEGYDWYLWADCDDILTVQDELRPVAKKALDQKLDSVFFTYWYSIAIRRDGTYDEQTVQIEHLRERLLRPKVFKWVSRIHEVAVPKEDGFRPIQTSYDYNLKEKRLLAWVHLTTDEKVDDNTKRNTRLIKLQIKDEKGKDPRTLFYLAKTLYDTKDNSNHQEILNLLEKYLKTSGWEEERANAYEYMAQVYEREGKHQEALDALHRGIAEYPKKHMLHLGLAKIYSILGRHDKSDYWIDSVLRLDAPKSDTTIGNPLQIKYLTSLLMYNRAIRLQKLDEAIYWTKIKNTLIDADDDGLIKTLEEAREMDQAAKNVFNYAVWLKKTGNITKIRPLLDALTDDLGKEPFAAYIANDIAEPKVWGPKSIVYFASWGFEAVDKWSPKSLEKGLGGSETAVVELTKRWAKMGYEVTVYGDPRDDEGVYEGVTFLPFYRFNWKDLFNILILWRAPYLLNKEIHTNKLFYDAHDIELNTNWTPDRVEKIDKVFFKSKYHRSMVPSIPDNKAVVISNGITL